MGGIFSWLIIGVILYLMLTKRGVMMGCCGGHNHNLSGHPNHSGPHGRHLQKSHEDIIDLKKEDYHVKTKG